MLWMPDGNLLGFADDGAFVYDNETGETRDIEGPTEVRQGASAISPDGQWLYYSVRDISADIWVADRQSPGPR